MQSFPDYTLFEVFLEALDKGCRTATDIFQPKHAEYIRLSSKKDSKYIRESTKEHLRHFSNQIFLVEENYYKALLKNGCILKIPTKWVKEATSLKYRVSYALKEQQNSKDPSVKDKELERMCNEIFDYMKGCPVQDVNDKPLAFIAPMHETEDSNLSDSNVPKEVGSSDISVSSPGRREGKETVTTGSESETVSFPESCGPPLLKLSSRRMLAIENIGAEALEGESSHAHEAVISKISRKDSSSPYISQVLDENKSEVIEEGDAPKGTLLKRTRTVVKQINRPQRRRDKRPIGASDPTDVPAYSSNVGCGPELRVLTSETNPSEESIHHGEGVAVPRKIDKFCFARVSESQLGTIIPILATGEMSEHVDLRLEISSMPSSQVKPNLNSRFGLDPKKDKYLFSGVKRPETSHADGTSLPEYLIVNRSGSGSKEMPTADEWRQAGVVNLIDKIVSLPSVEPDCPNLVLLFLQRNGRLTNIPTSFFNQMPALRFLDFSYTRIKALPSSLFNLTDLQVLLLRSCACLDSLPADVKKLKNLEVLDLLGTYLSYLPEEIGELTQLRKLQLSFYRPDNESKSELVTSHAILKLQALQELSIEVHPKDQYWIRNVEGIIQYVRQLKMNYLQFYFPRVEDLKSFIGVRLGRFKFIVGDNIKRIISRVPDEVESMYDQHDRCLRFVNGREVPEVMKSVLTSVTAFYLDHHLEIQSLSEFDISSFNELKFCVLRECPNIQVMIIGEKRTESAFAKLEYLGLHYLWKLDRIWEDPIPPGSFQALKYMMVSTCGELKYIASHSILQCLSNLETFIIEDCESLRSIVKENELVKHGARLLPRLKELVLRHLPQLVALGSGLFPSEEIISRHFCPKLILRPGHSRIELKKLLSSSFNCRNICNSSQI